MIAAKTLFMIILLKIEVTVGPTCSKHHARVKTNHQLQPQGRPSAGLNKRYLGKRAATEGRPYSYPQQGHSAEKRALVVKVSAFEYSNPPRQLVAHSDPFYIMVATPI